MENKIADNNKRHLCPECDKSFKHLIPHLKSKHAWNVEDIFDFKKKEKNSLTVMSTDAASDAIEEARYSARKVSEVELEEEHANANARRAVDKLILMNALSEMSGTIGAMYEKIENGMNEISSDVTASLMRTGYDTVDGPRRDSMRCVRETLEPSCQHLRECMTHEMCRIVQQLKDIFV
jgi:hypothetical protein